MNIITKKEVQDNLLTTKKLLEDLTGQLEVYGNATFCTFPIYGKPYSEASINEAKRVLEQAGWTVSVDDVGIDVY